jgi:hypothetical protein
MLRLIGQRHAKSRQRIRTDGCDSLFDRSILAASLAYVAFRATEVHGLTDLLSGGLDARVQGPDALAGLEIQIGKVDDTTGHLVVSRCGDSESPSCQGTGQSGGNHETRNNNLGAHEKFLCV